MIKAGCLSVFIFFLHPFIWAQELAVVYPSPLRYEKIDGQLQADANLVYRGKAEGLTLTLGGQALPYTRHEDSLRVQLPLTGDKMDLVLQQGGHIISTQFFEPFIPADWNYFGKGTIDIISSSHQDIAWMNTPDSCRMERIEKIIVPALHMTDHAPTFRFGMEQTLNLMELIRQDPAYEDAAVRAYQKGQFGWGATFNQPYEGLESSEQLVRQLYLGRKWVKDHFNGRIDSRTAFNMDVPGRTPQLPQILARAGVQHLFISRFKEGFYNWYSPDGSKIFTYSPGNYGWAVMFYKYFDTDAPTAMHKLHEVMKNWNTYYSSRHIPPHYGIVISNDASGPVYYEKVLEEWNRIVDASGLSIPHLRYATADQFLDSVDVPGALIDSISGERPNLWLYIHGPAHYEAIKAKRAAAVHLPAAEMFNTVAGLLNNGFNDYPKMKFDTAWYKSIYPDHGWGGKHGDITDSIYRAYLETADGIALQTLYPALEHIAASIVPHRKDPVVVFNDLSWDRDAIAFLPVKDSLTPYAVMDADGKTIPSQPVHTSRGSALAIVAQKVPAIGYSTYYLSRAKTKKMAAPAGKSNAYENEFYEIVFGDGGIKKIYDKELRQDLLNTTRFAGGDVLDLGYDGLDAGEFTEITPANMNHFDKLSNHTALWAKTSDGPVFTTFESRYTLGSDIIIQRITIYRQIKKIDLEYEIPDWKGIKGRQLSFALPLNTPDAVISYDVPMGMATVNSTELQMRPGGWAWDGSYRQKPEEIHPRESQNFVTAAAAGFGITLSSRLAVFDWIDPTRESVSYPVLQAVMLTTQKSCHGEGPWYYQRGRHVFNFSIGSDRPGWKNAFAFGLGNNHELYAVTGAAAAAADGTAVGKKASLPEKMSFFRSSAPYTMITALKKADKGDDVILRVVNMDGSASNNNIYLFRDMKSVSGSNLIEEAEENMGQQGREIRLPMGKSAIQTLAIGFK